MNAFLFNFTDYVLLAYSSLSRYEAYETLTDKTKLKCRNYQENSRLHDKKLEAVNTYEKCAVEMLHPGTKSGQVQHTT